ncbi:hypothetical protein F5B22DRAFT_30804 [Xylaria bambusicola]|uniref:uncharacterized protein n=1 Tax=Xylaria bambusicola TaxID=326684 RepID=UPI002008B7CD|nr:uncharacterized protein F5B22DRAFT_30804 [Xylaria bambusicola]KAI0528308.1 hypothetical protein F5B22DRAFT_30804 [Xylaria bambusicola]
MAHHIIMPSSDILTPPSEEEIISWLYSECEPTLAEMFQDWVALFDICLRERFTRAYAFWPMPEELHVVTDTWVQALIAQNSRSPTRVEYILGLAFRSLNRSNVSERMKIVMRHMDIPRAAAGSDNVVLDDIMFPYLVWRYELMAEQLSSLGGLTDRIENVRLDDSITLGELSDSIENFRLED